MDTVHLHIGEQETVFTVGASREPLAVLPIGTARPGARAFRSSPPDALDLEDAIEGIEDAVMPLARTLPPGARLVTADLLASRIPGAGGGELSRDAVERAFNLLADVAEGRPASHGGEVVQPELAAYVLILREAMHHLGYEAVAFAADGAQGRD
jgi:hypothetical protein